MNVAALLHDSPSDDLRRRQARQDPENNPPPPQQHHQLPHRPPHHSPPLDPPRDHQRDHDRPPQDILHPSHSQQQLPYPRSPAPHLPPRPPSPPRHSHSGYGAPPTGSDYPGHSQRVHHLPPPSALLQEVGHQSRRANQEVLPHPHDRLGPPPGPSNAPVQAQPFVVEHRAPGLLPSNSHPHHQSHHPHHVRPHSSTPSSMYMPPPPGRGLPPHGQHIHGPGQGSIPLFPTPVGPGVPPGGPPIHPSQGPPPPSSGMDHRISEPPMYAVSPHQSQRPSPHLHTQHPHHPHPHDRHDRHDRHRGRGSSTSSSVPSGPGGPGNVFDIKSSTSSPVMASLQRPASYGRERDIGPGTGPRGSHVGAPGAGASLASSSLPTTPIGPGLGLGRSQEATSHMLPGPGLHPGSLGDKRERERERERERGMERSMERDRVLERERERERERVAVAMDRERDRRNSGASIRDSPEQVRRERDQRERERQAMKERELMERREREMRERELHEREMREREREREQRERESQIQQERERDHREQLREREMREHERQREQREREREREQGWSREHAEDMMGRGMGPGIALTTEEIEQREWYKKSQMQQIQRRAVQPQPQPQPQPPLQVQTQQLPPPPSSHSMKLGPPLTQGSSQVWSRFVAPQIGPPAEDERLAHEREREMERRRGMEDMRTRELEWDDKVDRERPSRGSKSRTVTKDREERERERATKASQGGERADRRSRNNVREKEKEREREREKAEIEERERQQREREQERERENQHEHEFRVRERELAWQEFELLGRERIQRERQDMEAVRSARSREAQGQAPLPGAPHPFHHHPHLGGPGPQPPVNSKSQASKQGAIGTTPLPPDFPPHLLHEREREFRQGPPPKGSGSIALSQINIPPPHPSQLNMHQQIQHPHPGRQHHPQDAYGHPGGMAYPPRRASPPPSHPASAPPVPGAAFMLPRLSSPPAAAPALAVRHLGTFVFPRTPFPFLDFPAPTTESSAPADPLDVRATVFVPARFLPLTRPVRPRIWGGALIPAVPPLSGAQRQLCLQYGGTHTQYGRPWPDEVREGRRVYTDDSDLFLCALHAGWVGWSAARRARREGRDLRMEVRLTREARFVGGFGSALRVRERVRTLDGEDELGVEDDGSSLLSSGWGNGHDGAGMEILSAEFVAPGTAHSFGLRNRSQRLLEYAERRCALGCTPRLGRKRRRLHGLSFTDGESAVQVRLDLADEELCATRIMVFGTDSSWPEIGFKYHPDALKTILFPQSSSESRPSKRRKLASVGDNAALDTSPTDPGSEDDLVEQRAVVVETLWESFLISQRGQILSGELESDKENAAEAIDGAQSGRRYVIALLTNAGGTAGKLPRRTKVHDALESADTPAAAAAKSGAPASDPPQVNVR